MYAHADDLVVPEADDTFLVNKPGREEHPNFGALEQSQQPALSALNAGPCALQLARPTATQATSDKDRTEDID
jgi:hypothetical protein